MCALLLSATLFVILTACGVHDSGDSSSEEDVPSEEDGSSGEDGFADAEGELAYALSEDGESYTVTGKGTVTGRYINIPSEYNGKPVTAIGDNAFSASFHILGVTIPSSVKSIESWAFSGCKELESIVFGGTSEEWNAIEKHLETWDSLSGRYTVYCTDGEITK